MMEIHIIESGRKDSDTVTENISIMMHKYIKAIRNMIKNKGLENTIIVKVRHIMVNGKRT
jgi:hypothetical protein